MAGLWTVGRAPRRRPRERAGLREEHGLEPWEASKVKSSLLMGVVSWAAVACTVSAQGERAGGNLIVNSSFEILDEGGLPAEWQAVTNESVVFLDSTAARDGKVSLYLELDGRETLIGQSSYTRLEPGKPYTLSAYIRTQDLQPAEAFQLQVINLGWSFGYQSCLPIRKVTSDWHRVTRTFVCPPADAFPYRGQDNVEYKVVVYAKGARGQVWLEALQLEEGLEPSPYARMARESSAAEGPASGGPAGEVGRKPFRRDKYWQVANPLCEELLGTEPGPDCVLYYGYDDLMADEIKRPYHKKFGLRYVLHEERRDLETSPFIPMTNAWPRGGVGTYPTMRMILRPDAKGVAPPVFGDDPWIMDPRWQEAYVERAVELAHLSGDGRTGNHWGNTWGLWAGDEVFESAGIKEVPKNARYQEVVEIDREIRDSFGFGKYGMPDGREDANPFRRIAFRRWVNARLAETYKRTYALVKEINPNLVMLGPDPCGSVPAVDLEAMTPYFDLVSSQTWYSPLSYTSQLATGADTKAMVDLSECPVWSLVQHSAATTPEAVREQYSQVFRNGGQGIILLGVEWYDRELEHPKYVNPAKWRAMLELARTVTGMKRLRLPRPEAALLYASDTYLTFDDPKMANAEHPHTYAAYGAIGPGAGSWLRFVSDRQIARGTRDLADYKVLYIALATYQRRSVLDRIEQYIRGGGVVVCADETAFTWDINGDDLSRRWEKVSGLKRGGVRTGPTLARTVSHAFLKGQPELAVRFPQPGITVRATEPSVKPLAVFADGSLAAAIRPYGEGWVVSFASNPFGSPNRNTKVIELVRAVQRAAGAELDQMIWRFKLPPFTTLGSNDTEQYHCLTDNHVVLDTDSKMASSRNVQTAGTYTYDRFPSCIGDARKAGEIPFPLGHLTNRKAAYAERRHGGSRNPPALDKWIVSWTDPEPFRITFDLKATYSLDRLRLFYSGVLPDLNVRGSTDGETWDLLGSKPAGEATADVDDAIVLLRGASRFLRVDVGRRRDGVTLELAELEIWGGEEPIGFSPWEGRLRVGRGLVPPKESIHT